MSFESKEIGGYSVVAVFRLVGGYAPDLGGDTDMMVGRLYFLCQAPSMNSSVTRPPDLRAPRTSGEEDHRWAEKERRWGRRRRTGEGG
jgi:hypothetical protein